MNDPSRHTSPTVAHLPVSTFPSSTATQSHPLAAANSVETPYLPSSDLSCASLQVSSKDSSTSTVQVASTAAVTSGAQEKHLQKLNYSKN